MSMQPVLPNVRRTSNEKEVHAFPCCSCMLHSKIGVPIISTFAQHDIDTHRKESFGTAQYIVCARTGNRSPLGRSASGLPTKK